MRESVASAPTAALRRPGWLASLAERVVRKALGGLRHGSVGIASAGRFDTYGTNAAVGPTVRVRDPDFWTDVAFGGTLGAAESYIRGRWDTDELTALIRLFARNLSVSDHMDRGWARAALLAAKGLHALHSNTRQGSTRNIQAHYDVGNDFFRLVLDRTLSYSCAVFAGSDDSLEAASLRKIDLACHKLDLSPTDHLLEIGAGWGALAIRAARRYGCRVTTTTVSREQFELARRRVRAAGLADRVKVLLRDYRDLNGSFDKIVSVEMIEAVGHKFLPTYFSACSRLLNADGMMLLQAILMAEHRYDSYRRSVDFIQRYVFPGSCLVSMAAVGRALAAGTDFRMVHLEDLASDYAETLRRWRANLLANRDAVLELGHTEEFARLWEFYLCYCEAGFEERSIGAVQLLLAKPGNRRPPVRTEVGLL